MTRRAGPAAAALAMVLALGACGRRSAGPAPGATPGPARNVVLIVLDTVRADHLSSYGYSRPTSPRLDAFGRDHVRFEQARSQATCTYPSVNSLLTSRSAFRFLGQRRRHIGIPATFPTLAERLRTRGFKTGAVSASSVVRATRSEHNEFGEFDRGFDSFDETCIHRRADCVNRKARRFLNHTAEPFFLYLQYLDPHARYDPPAEFEGRFTEPYDGPQWVKDGNPRPLYESLAGLGPHVEATTPDLRHLIALYDTEVAFLDQQVGELLDDLSARGLLESTVVVIAADHGEEFLEHGWIWHCENLFDTTLRVPLFVHVPGIGPQAPIAAAVDNLDLVPTILAAVGAPAAPELEGRSLLPLLRGDAQLRLTRADAQLRLPRGDAPPLTAHTSFALQNERRSASDGRFKLIADVGDGTMAFYDLATDPGETHDVAATERAAFHRLRGELAQWLLRVEGTTDAAQRRALADETRRLLQSLGYLQ